MGGGQIEGAGRREERRGKRKEGRKHQGRKKQSQGKLTKDIEALRECEAKPFLHLGLVSGSKGQEWL